MTKGEGGSGDAFVRAFLPGLVLGLVIGAFAGAFVVPVLTESTHVKAAPLTGGSHAAGPARERGEEDAMREGMDLPDTLPDEEPAQPQEGEEGPIDEAGESPDQDGGDG